MRKILIILLFLIFSFVHIIATYAGTAQVGSMNGFGSHSKGLSSNNSFDDLINIQRDHELKSKDVFALKSLEPINESSHLQIQDLFLKSYKRLIQGMIQNNILSLDSLKQVIEGKDYFFFSFFKENLDINKNIYKNAFSSLYKNIEKLEENINIYSDFIEILNNESNLLQAREGVRVDSLRETAEVFAPNIINKIKANKMYGFKQIQLQSGEGFFVFVQDENTLAIHNSKTSEFLFSVNSNTSKSFNVQYLKNEKKSVLYYNDRNKFVVIDLESREKIHEVNLEGYFFSYSLNPEIIEYPDGSSMIILNLVNLKENKYSDVIINQNLMNFYDYKTGKMIHPALSFSGSRFFDSRYIIKNKEGKYVIVLVFSKAIYFIDPLTGKEIYYNKKIPFLNRFYQKKAASILIFGDDIKDVIFLKNDQGEDVLVFKNDNFYYFINPFTGKQIYEKKFSNSLWYINEFFIFDVDEKKVMITVDTKERMEDAFYFRFIDIKTNQSIFPAIKISGFPSSIPFIYKNNSEDWKFVIKTEKKEYYSVFDLKTGNQEFVYKSTEKVPSINAFHIFGRNKIGYFYYPQDKNTISFIDRNTGNSINVLTLTEDCIDKVYFFQNAQGIHESGMALGTTNGVSHWYFFNLYSNINKSEMGSEQ